MINTTTHRICDAEADDIGPEDKLPTRLGIFLTVLVIALAGYVVVSGGLT